MKNFFGRAALAWGVLSGVAMAAPAPSQTDIVNSRSPFLPEGGGPGAAPTENAPIELRGIVSTSHGDLFALFDPSKHQSVWVGLNDTSAPFVVRAHDVTNETVTVEYQGRTLTLPLKAAKIESMGPVPNPAQVVSAPRPMMGPNNVSTPQTISNPSAAEEARRLEAVAAEVRRRRMLRQAAQQSGQPMPTFNSPPMPQGQAPR